MPLTHFLRACSCLVIKLWLTLCNPADCSTPGFPALHYLLEFAHIHVHWVSDAISPSHPLLPSSPVAFNLSQHQGLLRAKESLFHCIFLCVRLVQDRCSVSSKLSFFFFFSIAGTSQTLSVASACSCSLCFLHIYKCRAHEPVNQWSCSVVSNSLWSHGL